MKRAVLLLLGLLLVSSAACTGAGDRFQSPTERPPAASGNADFVPGDEPAIVASDSGFSRAPVPAGVPDPVEQLPLVLYTGTSN